MNCGAEHARHEILLFLHSDNYILPEAILSIEQNIKKNGFIGGCLTQRIDNHNFIYRLIESQGNIRAILSKVFYGEQGIFMKKDIFFKIGGFPEVPIMEDILLTKQLRKIGNTSVLPDRIFARERTQRLQLYRELQAGSRIAWKRGGSPH